MRRLILLLFLCSCSVPVCAQELASARNSLSSFPAFSYAVAKKKIDPAPAGTIAQYQVVLAYGSQNQQLQQSATNFNLFSELRTGGTAYDARQIRALTSTDVVSVGGQAAADAVAAGNPVLLGAFAESDGAALVSVSAEADASNLKTNLEGRLLVQTDHPRRVNCTISSTATTSTLITGCSAPGAGLSIYVTDFDYTSSIIGTTTNFATLQSGTGGSCGTTTTVVWRGTVSVAFGSQHIRMVTPIKLTANHELCFLNPGAGTRWVNVRGYIAP